MQTLGTRATRRRLRGSASLHALVCGCLALPAATCSHPTPSPRPIAPLSAGVVTSHTPIFRWELPSGEVGAHVEICADRACTVPVERFDATGTSGMPPAPLSPGVYFWRLFSEGGGPPSGPSPVWELTVGPRSTPVNSSFGPRFDVNGDGYADLIAAASTKTSGTLRLYLGTRSGVEATPSVIIPEPPPSAIVGGWGNVLSAGGDINGDGFADLIVGSTGTCMTTDTPCPQSAIYLYLGSAQGLATTPASVVVGGPGFAWTLTAGGDLNGDGYGDVIVGTPFGAIGNARGAWIFYGGPDGLTWNRSLTLPIPAALAGASPQDFGAGLAMAGDLNGDGYGDLVVSAPRDAAVFVYLGAAGGAVGNSLGCPPAREHAVRRCSCASG